MVAILRGKHKGQTATIHQFCNDWFTVDVHGGPAAQRLLCS